MGGDLATGTPVAFVASDIQRVRILSALFDLCYERGGGNVSSVARVVERSGVSRRTFYEIFADREDCFLAAFEQALAYACERVLPAFESADGWAERIRAGLAALLQLLDEEPAVGRLLIVESRAGGAAAQDRRKQVLGALTAAIEQGHEQDRASILPPQLTRKGVLGGVLAVIQSRLLDDEDEPLSDLVSPLMSMIVLPYLGVEAARRELERSAATASRRWEYKPFASDPFKGVGMRLTYRTVRVLMAIADRPGASNRLIAATAQIKDQGQISKLLTRLQRTGVVANTGTETRRGMPNAWMLTPQGHQMVATIRAHTEGTGPGGARDESSTTGS